MGGAVYARNGAQVTLSRVTASGNRAKSGGAINTFGPNTTLTLSEFVAQGNHAMDSSGALVHRGGALTITNSLFTDNVLEDTDGVGGALQANPADDTTILLTIVNSTFQGNVSKYGSALSAAKLSPGSLVANSTFANNTGDPAIMAWVGAWVGANLTLKNTLVSNSANGRNCDTDDGGSIVDGGNNLQWGGNAPFDSCGLSIPQMDPKLASLADNGGFSQTMALQPGSPAINAGSGCEAVDQRFVARPIGPACDIGAFEAPLAAPPGGGGGNQPPGGSGVAEVPTLTEWVSCC
jgi:hypothetical protein